MKQADFTIQDVKDFMLEVCKLKWYGEILDYELGRYRTATIEDFNRYTRSELIVVPIRSEFEKKFYDSTRIQEIGFIIFGDMFRVPAGRDYSNEWQEFKAHRKTETLGV